ncbi:polyribonucleotide nucleotidyltransferase [Myxococcota bacterium]|nr:polyribonucleotide nucleotidyltransferase [Myxococcota bacterium]MBU1429016.1 polyribonucleotide nucleotidyltransferase [Myxococcota bacterium]MBU1898428.1 polyribonucleotide nucleotidyltransferase [Myxococcota bacterium]
MFNQSFTSPLTVQAPFGHSPISLETGKMARQAGGAVVVRQGETVVLVTVTGSHTARPGVDFLPLTCDYIEKKYAAGKIPGGYFKRESRPDTWEILKARLIDRPMRPLFPKGWRKEVQIIATVLSYDHVHDPGVCAMVGASAATGISDIPFDGPMAGCCVALIDGEFKINPPLATLSEAKLHLIVAATEDAVTMVEGEGKEASEEEMIEAIIAAHEAMKPIIALQRQMIASVGKAKQLVEAEEIDVALFERVLDLSIDGLAGALTIPGKHERHDAISEAKRATVDALLAADPALEQRIPEIKGYFYKIEREIVRSLIVEDGLRLDGRGLTDVRPIACDVGVLPRTHGSALFTRGETQALATVTLGGRREEMRIDNLDGDTFQPFMLHYNFPPFCTGEAKFLRGTSRREIGHGTLAQRGVASLLPAHDDFAYTIRIVSEVLESNGSSSMATVCASSMALMSAGVPIKKDVAGIAMGLIQEDDKIAVLSDILGDEDHLGDMDFKVVGTEDGINALQMDIKVKGLSRAILRKALSQAKAGRLHILGEMRKAITQPADDLSRYAPRALVTYVKPDRIRDIIGPGGKTIRGISEQTGCSIDVDDTGKVTIFSPDMEAAKQAEKLIHNLTEEAEVGKIYMGTVQKIMDFGAFVEILPGTDGLVHISELAEGRVARVEDVLEEGQEIAVKCIGVDRNGKIRLSRREAISEGFKL